MGVRVLLIEDDETIAEPLADGLRHFGLTVHHVATGADGLRGPHGDVVLLDLGLPDMDGIDVCRGIRRVSDVPLIILSARGEEADRVLGLELGADDYLAKPFSIRELVARIRAVSRRHQRPTNGSAAGVVAGVVVAEAGPGSVGLGGENDFTATSAFEVGDGLGGEGEGGGEGAGAGAGSFGSDESGGLAVGDVGGRGTGRRRAGFGVGARGPEYDWSAAHEASAYETPAHEAPAYETPAHEAPPTAVDPVFGDPAFDITPAQGTPPQRSPRYGSPAYGNPAYEPSSYEPPAYAPSVPPPPAYEPPMYEQAPPGPRPPAPGPTAGDDGSAPPPPGPLVVDRRTRQVWVGEVPVALTPKEFELLALLTEDPGAVYSRQQILNRVWDDHYQGPTKTLDVHVATLRRKLGDPAWIQTLRGVGFRLAVRSPGQAPGQSLPQNPGPGHGRGRGAGSGRHRTPGARASAS
ncbi:winged helix-turn-helix domain-containing protein [Streptomyces bottropensis]|uniref:winged helix-turn-helix transcriptional regulator n=2 Tax=Streptomyces bottropensis TaxID=42235 RepID=UPI0036854948